MASTFKPSRECMAQAKAASGGRLTDDELREAFERIAVERDRLTMRGEVDGMAERLLGFASQEVAKTRVAAAEARRQAELNVVVRDKLHERMDDLTAGGLKERDALLAILEGAQSNVAGTRNSVFAHVQAYENKYAARHAELVKAIPAYSRLMSDERFNNNTAREMVELREGGTPGITGDKDAQAAAKIFAKHAEIARQDLNKLGASIGKLDGWAGAQTHDDVKITLAGRETWKDAIVQRLDLARTFEGLTTADEIGKALDGVFDNIVTGVRSGVTPPASGRVNPANMAKSLGKERVLHFKSAEDAEAYRHEFGYGLLTSAMEHHFRLVSRKAGAMEVFGPNPENMVRTLTTQRQQRLKEANAAGNREEIERLRSSSITGAVDMMTGAVNIAGNARAADISSKIRMAQSAAKLGGALISSIPSDVMTTALASQFRGSGFVEGFIKQIGGVLAGRPKGEQREIGLLLGDAMEGMSAEIANATYANDGVSGVWAKTSDRFFRWTGLTWWTDVMRSVARRTISAEAGMRANVAYADLPANYRHVLGLHDIRETEWDAIRSGAFQAENGKTYITPDRIQDEGAAMAFRRFVADELNYAVIETDAASRRFATFNATRPGTLAGESVRFVMQFKGFPIAFTQRVLGRTFKAQRADASMVEKGVHIGSLIAGMTVAGYAAMTMKDVVKGNWPPRDPLDPKTIIAAAQQGGGLGLYGDYLFGEVNRFGGGVLESAAGPTLGNVAQAIELVQKSRDAATGEKALKGSDALNLALSNTPFANLFYVKPALDYLVLDAIRESLSPGTAARKAARRRSEYGQERFLPDSSMALRF